MNKETIILHAFITKCYTEYGSFIKNYISYRIPHKYEAEDLTQEVMGHRTKRILRIERKEYQTY